MQKISLLGFLLFRVQGRGWRYASFAKPLENTLEKVVLVEFQPYSLKMQ